MMNSVTNNCERLVQLRSQSSSRLIWLAIRVDEEFRFNLAAIRRCSRTTISDSAAVTMLAAAAEGSALQRWAAGATVWISENTFKYIERNTFSHRAGANSRSVKEKTKSEYTEDTYFSMADLGYNTPRSTQVVLRIFYWRVLYFLLKSLCSV